MIFLKDKFNTDKQQTKIRDQRLSTFAKSKERHIFMK